MNEWINKMNGWYNGKMNEWTNKGMNEGMDKVWFQKGMNL